MDQDLILRVKHLQVKIKVGRRMVHAVNDVSFDLKRGKTLGIVGESGCGKSVTARAIMQLLPKAGNITKGKIEYFGKDKPVEIAAYKRNSKKIRNIRGADISMIFQDPMSALNPVYSIGSQISENLLQHERMTKKEARVRVVEMLKDLGIPIPEQRYDEYPHQFSGGMRQRVMIGIAMICNPSILIADEPTTALDVTIQAQILELMKRVQQQHGTSVILITHNMGIVAESCDDVAVMYMGRVVEYGTLEQVFNHPLHPYTCALMRSVPVLGIGKDKKLESIKGSTPDASIEFTHCEFAERCEHCTQRCLEGLPQDRILPDGHRVRCFRYAEEGEAND